MSSYLKENRTLDWHSSVSAELKLVESVMCRTVASDIHSVQDVAGGIVNAGGKRIRPILILLSSLTCGGSGDSPEIIELAAAIELIHTASLVHDDVVDDAVQRRGRPTANSTWGSKISVLSGDYMLSKAFALLARQSKPEILAVISEVAGVMSESQVLETECLGSLELWQTNYWRCIEGKTAAFMSSCCECGAIFADAGLEYRMAIREYGLRIGLSFQISDDILDVTGRQSTVGKDLGADIRSGKYTLPLLLAIESDKSIGTILEDNMVADKIDSILSSVICSGAVEKAKLIALEQCHKASAALEMFPESEYKQSLLNLAEYIVNRQH